MLGFHRPFLELHRTLLLADQGEIQLTGTLRRRFQLFDLNQQRRRSLPFSRERRVQLGDLSMGFRTGLFQRRHLVCNLFQLDTLPSLHFRLLTFSGQGRFELVHARFDLLKTGNLLHQLIRRFPLRLQMGLQFHDARGMTGPFRNLLGQLLGTMLLIGQSRLQFADPVHLSRDSIQLFCESGSLRPLVG